MTKQKDNFIKAIAETLNCTCQVPQIFYDIKKIDQALDSYAAHVLREVMPEKDNHEKKGINPKHSKDEYWGCCECYEDIFFNNCIDQIKSKAKDLGIIL